MMMFWEIRKLLFEHYLLSFAIAKGDLFAAGSLLLIYSSTRLCGTAHQPSVPFDDTESAVPHVKQDWLMALAEMNEM